MTLSLADLHSSTALTSPRILLYGSHGVGKSTFAASAPHPVLIDIEDGARALDVPTFGVLRALDLVTEAMGVLCKEEHDFRTVIVDSLSALEPLVWKLVCKRNGWRDIETPGYGKGFLAASDVWNFLLDGVDALRDHRMTVILIAHSEIKRVDNPETEPYGQYQPRLQARAAALLQERVDCVLFANYRTAVLKTDVGFNRKVARGVGNGERVLHTTERPAALAKNRFGMPDTLPLSWEAVAATIPYFSRNGHRSNASESLKR